MDISVDCGTILPIIYPQIVDGFDEVLTEMDENTCVLSIGNIVSRESEAYFFLYTLMNRRFDPIGSFEELYGFKLSSRLRGDGTKIIVNKEKFKFPGIDSDIILNVVKYLKGSSEEEDTYRIEQENNNDGKFIPLGLQARRASKASSAMIQSYQAAIEEIERKEKMLVDVKNLLQEVQEELGNMEDGLEKAQKEVVVLKKKLRQDGINKEISASKRESGMKSNEDGSFVSRQQKYETKRIVEKELNHCCNTTKKKEEILTILAVEHLISWRRMTRQRKT